MRRLVVGNRLRCTRGYDLPTAGTALWTKIDQPVGGLDDIQVVLNDHHRVTPVAESVQDLQQLPDIFKMKTRCRFVQYV